MRIPEPQEYCEGRGILFSSHQPVGNPVKLFTPECVDSRLPVFNKVGNLVVKASRSVIVQTLHLAQEPVM
jgi:hypothetical protein